MKKLLLLTALFTCTIFTSCSNDDDNTGITEANLIGKWQYIGATENGVAETLDECDLMDTIEFSADHKGKSNTFYTKTTTTNGQTTTTCEVDGDSSFTWSLSGDQLTTSFGPSEDSDTGTILEINSSTLKLEFPSKEEGNTVKDIYIETYKRI